jgi:hypothetical protein
MADFTPGSDVKVDVRNPGCQSGYLFFRVAFQSLLKIFMELSRNFSEIWIQNGGNWK